MKRNDLSTDGAIRVSGYLYGEAAKVQPTHPSTAQAIINAANTITEMAFEQTRLKGTLLRNRVMFFIYGGFTGLAVMAIIGIPALLF